MASNVLLALLTSTAVALPLTGIDQGVGSNFTVSAIPTAATFEVAICQVGLSLSDASSISGESFDLGYDQAVSFLPSPGLLDGIAGIWINRPLAAGEHLDVSVPGEDDVSDPCGTFIQQFGAGDGAGGCLLFEQNSTCVHLWMEAPVVLPYIRPIDN